MKLLKHFISLCFLVPMSQAFAIPAPVYTDWTVIKAIFNDSSIMNKLAAETVSGIDEVTATSDGYLIKADDCRLEIKVEVLHDQSIPPVIGGYNFRLVPQDVFCVRKASLSELDQEIGNTVKNACQFTSDCATAGFYKRSCGGFENFIIYSRVDTDEAYLSSLLEAHYDLDDPSYLTSICMIEAPPMVDCVKSSCERVDPIF